MKKAIVTGASSGIGHAIALDLAGAGYSVVASGRDTERLDALAGTQAGIFPLAADLATEDGCRRLVEDAMAQLGSLDLLVNNAGITRDALLVKHKDGETQKMTLEAWQQVVDVNLTGVFLCGREAAAKMVETDRPGVIVNISSLR